MAMQKLFCRAWSLTRSPQQCKHGGRRWLT
jgi:hypothetical protein